MLGFQEYDATLLICRDLRALFCQSLQVIHEGLYRTFRFGDLKLVGEGVGAGAACGSRRGHLNGKYAPIVWVKAKVHIVCQSVQSWSRETHADFMQIQREF